MGVWGDVLEVKQPRPLNIGHQNQKMNRTRIISILIRKPLKRCHRVVAVEELLFSHRRGTSRKIDVISSTYFDVSE